MTDSNTETTARYRVTVDREACDGVFACLTRDPRFVEDDAGLATLDPDADPAPPAGSDDGEITETAERVVGEFVDHRVQEAEQAAAACPFDAIDVTELEAATDGGEES
ncbi:ferredoxin [Halobaculum sp. MBLA0147]|uniref:ferredoxin n=1 Tax=Halobaculum sp. MBLA0147 TaxID=3079934 RepID=UPI00352609D2